MNAPGDREEQSERLREAVERKNADAEQEAEAARRRAEAESLDAADRPPDAADPRAKSTQHRKVTADKWNQ